MKEIVGISEHHEARRTQRIASDHVQQLHLDGVGKEAREHIDLTGSGVDRRESGSVMLELTRNGGVTRGLAADVERRRHIKMNVERRFGEIKRGILLAEQCLNVGQDFADGVRANRSWCVRAGSIDAIAGAIERRPARKMIILISGEDEERVAGRDAIICKTREELIEGAVIISKLLDVPRLPRSERSEGERVALVSVRDVGVGDRDTVFLHRSGVR